MSGPQSIELRSVVVNSAMLRVTLCCAWCAAAFLAPAPQRPALVRRFGKTRGDGASAADAGASDASDASDASPPDAAASDVFGDGKETSDMRVGELTAELDLRGVDYSDCVEADELRRRLKDARLAGRAAPEVLDRFNRGRAEAMMDPTKAVDPSTLDDLESLAGGDGSIPGGLAPDEIFKLMNDPEIMTMLQKPKFQEIMKDVMGGEGQAALQRHMADPESRDMMLKLTTLLQSAGMVPPKA